LQIKVEKEEKKLEGYELVTKKIYFTNLALTKSNGWVGGFLQKLFYGLLAVLLF
jgi:hypothetical protein